MRGSGTMRRAACVAALLLLHGIAFSGAANAQRAERTLWWNDPVIVGQIGLKQDQRTRMDAAYDAFAEKAAGAKRTREIQNAFHESLEKGDWKKAKGELDQWASQETNPQHAMAELKLDVLQLLSAEQRKALFEGYPRILRRQWRPALTWERAGQGNAKPFQGALQKQRLQEQEQKGKPKSGN